MRPETKAKIMDRRRRRMKIRKLMLNGEFNLHTIAALVNTSVWTVSRDMKWVQEQWAKRDDALLNNDGKRRDLRIAMLEENAFRAASGYERSKQDAVAGDPSFLRVFNDAVDKICKIEALYVKRHEHTGKDGGPIDLRTLASQSAEIADEEIAAACAAGRRLRSLIAHSKSASNGTN